MVMTMTSPVLTFSDMFPMAPMKNPMVIPVVHPIKIAKSANGSRVFSGILKTRIIKAKEIKIQRKRNRIFTASSPVMSFNLWVGDTFLRAPIADIFP